MVERARPEQPELAPLQRHRREDESRRDGREDEAGQALVEEHHHGDQAERHLLAGEERQRADVEDVHQQQHREQDQLAPLGRVAEEHPQVLEQELAPRHRQPGQRGAHQRAPSFWPRQMRVGAFLRLGVARPRTAGGAAWRRTR